MTKTTECRCGDRAVRAPRAWSFAILHEHRYPPRLARAFRPFDPATLTLEAAGDAS
jgi:hypothetical protein